MRITLPRGCSTPVNASKADDQIEDQAGRSISLTQRCQDAFGILGSVTIRMAQRDAFVVEGWPLVIRAPACSSCAVRTQKAYAAANTPLMPVFFFTNWLSAASPSRVSAVMRAVTESRGLRR